MSELGPLEPIFDELVEAIAQRSAEIVLERLEPKRPASASPFLTVAEAAELLRAKPQRIYDLLSSARLQRHRDGTRVLVERAELLAYLDGGNGRC